MAETDCAGIHAGTKSSTPGARPAFALFRRAFIIAPVAFGLDKLSESLQGWEQNLGPLINGVIPGTGNAQTMLAVGIVEILAGLAVTALPHFFGDRAQSFIDPAVNLASDALTRLLS